MRQQYLLLLPQLLDHIVRVGPQPLDGPHSALEGQVELNWLYLWQIVNMQIYDIRSIRKKRNGGQRKTMRNQENESN